MFPSDAPGRPRWPNKGPAPEGDRVTHGASDVERFAYCPMSWWLSSRGHAGSGAAVERGLVEHARAGSALAAVQRALAREATWSSIAVNLALFAASAAVLAAEIVWLDVSTALDAATDLLAPWRA
jgi:hypothetical protein